MENLPIEKSEWRHLLDRLSCVQGEFKVTVEVDRSDIGSQLEVENARLEGISYDPKDGDLSIAAGSVDHRIHNPVALSATIDGADLVSLEAVGEDKSVTIVTFKPKINLPDFLLPGDQ